MVLFGLGLEDALSFFAALAADILAVVVVVTVVVIAAAVVGFGVVGDGDASSSSGLTTTKEVTGVTKLYLRERLVALSASNLCIAGSVAFSLASSSSLMVKYAQRRCTKLEIPSNPAEQSNESAVPLPFEWESKTSFSNLTCFFESMADIDTLKSLTPGLTFPATTNSEPWK